MNEGGLDAVRSRIAQLQQLTGAATGQVAGSSLAVLGTISPSASTSGAAFAGVLAGVGTGAGAASSASGLSGSTSSSASAASGAKVVSIAKKYLGIPYRWGGTNPATGLDCSGLTQLVYKQVGISLPRVSRDQAKVGQKVASLADAKPGDLVFFNSPVTHVGIYVGNGKILDAPRTGKNVTIRSIWETPSAIRRVLPSASATGSAGSAKSAAGSVSGPYADLFNEAGRRYKVDPALLSAVAKAESAYNPKARSSAGAQGLMQLMPATARSLGVNAYDPAEAVDGAARLLAGHLRTYGGRTDLALAAYNAGPGAVKKYGGVPPYSETRTYIQRVNRYWEALR